MSVRSGCTTVIGVILGLVLVAVGCSVIMGGSCAALVGLGAAVQDEAAVEGVEGP